MKALLAGLLLTLTASVPAEQAPQNAGGQVPEYSIQAIRLADSPADAVADMLMGEPKGETIDTVYAMWLIRGGGRNILFDSGFHRER